MTRAVDVAYIAVLKRIFSQGEERVERTGKGTLAVFGNQMTFDMRDDFPLIGWKKTLWKKAFIEMLWFLRGDDNLKYLHEHDCHIWDEWADESGNLGPIYGVQWRKWPGRAIDKSLAGNYGEDGEKLSYLKLMSQGPNIDQIAELVHKLVHKPTDRRLLVSAWNPADIPSMGLPPCHRSFQCYVSNDKHLDMQVDIRSSDVGLGLPFNISQYAMLAHLLARAAALTPRNLIVNTGDTHVYLDHVDALKKWMDTYQPLDCQVQLQVNTDNIDIDGYSPADFSITGYVSNPHLPLPIAV